ncbi:cupin domain-containing protein [Streptomyces sp. NPDC006879]|uniref:cupin domain-containing protein n=1 Tax=Streptomyces sp. NPDC006879 TaxID=3364767 RepID=UPI00367F8C64
MRGVQRTDRARIRGSSKTAGGAAVPLQVPAATSRASDDLVSGVILAAGSAEQPMRVRTEASTDVIVREITIQPGGSTGWHYHPGQLIAVIKSGTLTRTLYDCSVEVTPAGSSFVEASGPRHVHLGRNLGTEPVVLYATYVLPQGSPLAIAADPPRCAARTL